jgi:hypothetical protein
VPALKGNHKGRPYKPLGIRQSPKGAFDGSFIPCSDSLVGKALFHFLSISFSAVLKTGTPVTFLGYAKSVTLGIIILFQVSASLGTELVILSAFMAGDLAGDQTSYYDSPNGSAT